MILRGLLQLVQMMLLKGGLNKWNVWIFFILWLSSGRGEDQANELDLPTSAVGELENVAELEGEEGEVAEGDEQLEDLEPFQGSQGSPLNDLDCSSESPTSPTLPGGGGFDFGRF